MRSKEASGLVGEGWARGYGWKERREVVPVMETRVSKSEERYKAGQGEQGESPGEEWGGGEGAQGLLSPAVFTLLLNLREQHGCNSQPAPSVTSSDTKYPGLNKKKKRESPHYMVGNPHTGDKIL